MHPELVRIENLVRHLEEAMADTRREEVDKSLFPIAAEYAELCKKANDRLETCTGILSAGKDKEYQALMAATRAPDVLDLCATLGELEAEEYREFCRANHLPVADALNETAKQVIDPIYSRAATFQKALMTEFSAANSKRDFPEALRVIRQVAALNPDDVNSVRQAGSLEDRLVGEAVERLVSPLRENNSAEILQILDEIEELAPGRVPKEGNARDAPWREAVAVRKDLEREAAIEQSENLLTEAETARESDDLNEVLTLVGRMNELMERHEFALKPGLRATHSELEDWSSEELRKWREEEAHKERLELLQTTVKAIRDKDFQRIKPGYDELEEDALSIRRQWKEISEARKPVPESLQDEARRTLADLEEKIAVKRRAKRRNLIATVSVGSVILIALATLAFLFWKAGQKANQLERALAGERATDLKRNLDQLAADKPMWKSLAGLPSTVEKARSWLNLEQANADRVNTMIQGLENDFKASKDPADWTEISLAAVEKTLNQCKQQRSEVNSDFQSDMLDRISALERTYNQIAEEKRNIIAPQFRENILTLDKLLRSALSGTPGSQEVKDASAAMGELISSMEAVAGTELDNLKPLAADLTTFEILKEKYGSLEANIKQSRQLNEELESATNLEDYAKALSKVENSDMVAGTAKIAVGNVIRKIRSADVVMREILMPGQLVQWTQLSEEKYNSAGYPSEVVGSEKPLFLGLRDDASLGKIHRYDAKESGKSRTVYSRGEPFVFQNSKIGEMTQTTAEGKEVYDPVTMGKSSAVFNPANYRARVSSSSRLGFVPENGSLSRESTFFQSLRLGGYVNPAVSNYRSTFLGAIEDIYASDDSVSPLFKAYLQLKIGELMMQRKMEWLLDFSPFFEHYEELMTLTANGAITSNSWLTPDEVARFSDSLSAFYAKHRGTTMAKEAVARHQFFSRLRAAGLEHCGFIDQQGNTKLVKKPSAVPILWGLDESLSFRPVLQREGENWNPLSKAATYSPLFHFVKDPSTVIQNAAAAARLDPENENYLKALPPLLRSTTF